MNATAGRIGLELERLASETVTKSSRGTAD